MKVGLRDYLNCEDRMSMMHGVEARVPFLIPRFMETASSLDVSMKLNRNETKFALRQSFRPWICPDVLERRDKVGYSSPIKNWLSHMREQIADTIEADSMLPTLMSRDFLGRTLGHLRADNWSHVDTVLLWRVFSVAYWNQNTLSQAR